MFVYVCVCVCLHRVSSWLVQKCACNKWRVQRLTSRVQIAKQSELFFRMKCMKSNAQQIDSAEDFYCPLRPPSNDVYISFGVYPSVATMSSHNYTYTSKYTSYHHRVRCLPEANCVRVVCVCVFRFERVRYDDDDDDHATLTCQVRASGAPPSSLSVDCVVLGVEKNNTQALNKLSQTAQQKQRMLGGAFSQSRPPQKALPPNQRCSVRTMCRAVGQVLKETHTFKKTQMGAPPCVCLVDATL